MENLEHQRKVYDRFELTEDQVSDNPMQQFRSWFVDAQNDPSVAEANAMCISTLEQDACPRSRMVLLKEYDWDGFIFYTNYESRKGRALQDNPKACLHFFWPSMERQIIIKADIEKISREKSEQYFHSRPKGSQLGALASRQSTIVPSREFLEKELKDLEKKYAVEEVPLPEYWGGYLAKPYEIEFWQGRPNRLHDRILYTLEDLDWQMLRLSP